MSSPPIAREQFPVTDRYCYLNHAGVAPLPLVAVEAGREFLDDFLHRGGVGFHAWDAHMEPVRASAARLMGVPAADVAFVKNTTEGLSFVANGLRWNPGDRVVVPDHEFPSTIYPWLSLRERGVQVDLIEPVGAGRTLPLEVFEDALTARPTSLVAVSWVQFGRGWRTDLAALGALCHEHGALLCVDAIQGLGVVPADFAAWGVDFAAADAHKWMVGPLGTGVFYVAEAVRDRLRPLEPGWAAVAHREEWDNLELVYDDSARRFEGGSQTLETIHQMGASMDLLLDTGIETIFDHVTALLDHTVAEVLDAGAVVLSDRSVDGRSGIITIDLPGHDADVVVARLETQHIVCAARGGGIRIAPHGYNTLADIDVLTKALARILRG